MIAQGLSRKCREGQACDLVGVKLEKFHELRQVCRICGEGVVFYNMAQYDLLSHKSLCNLYRIFNLFKFPKLI